MYQETCKVSNYCISEYHVFVSGKAITVAKGHESMLYESLRLLLVHSLKFTIVKMKRPNKQLTINKKNGMEVQQQKNTLKTTWCQRMIAQMAERLATNSEVLSSSPRSGSNEITL